MNRLQYLDGASDSGICLGLVTTKTTLQSPADQLAVTYVAVSKSFYRQAGSFFLGMPFLSACELCVRICKATCHSGPSKIYLVFSAPCSDLRSLAWRLFGAQ